MAWEMTLGFLLGKASSMLRGKSTPPVPFCVIGDQGAGKSTLHYTIQNDGIPTIRARVPTTRPGRRYRKKLYLPKVEEGQFKKTWWDGQDYQHDAAAVQEQVMEIMPRIIFVVLQHGRIFRHEVEELFVALSDTLASEEYHKRTQPRFQHKWPVSWWTPWKLTVKTWMAKSRCTHIIILYNKMDLIRGSPTHRKDLVLKAMNHFLREGAGHLVGDHSACGPLEYLRSQNLKTIFVATSLTEGSYAPYYDLESTLKFKDLLTEIVDEISGEQAGI